MSALFGVWLVHRELQVRKAREYQIPHGALVPSLILTFVSALLSSSYALAHGPVLGWLLQAFHSCIVNGDVKSPDRKRTIADSSVLVDTKCLQGDCVKQATVADRSSLTPQYLPIQAPKLVSSASSP